MEDEDEDRYWNDIDVVVVDVGSTQWRAGFASDEGPRLIMNVKPGESDEIRWRHIFEELESDPSDVAVLVSESPGVAVDQREHMATFLFRELNVAALYCVATPIMGAYGTDTVTGIIVDIGEHTTAVWAAFDGYPIVSAAIIVPAGGATCTDCVVSQLASLGFAPPSAEEARVVAQEIKEAHAHVAIDPSKKKKAPVVELTLADSTTIRFGGEDRSRCAEHLFDSGELTSHQPIDRAIIEVGCSICLHREPALP